MKYESSRIKFPSKVWRVRIEMRNGEWAIVKDVEIPSMTLPRHAPLPRSGEKRGVTGFLGRGFGYERRDALSGPSTKPARALDGSLRGGRLDKAGSLAVFSNITETGKQMAKAHQLARMPLDKLGGEYGRG